MKKDKYYAIAENMYVEKFITVAEIARRIGVHERTIKRWKKTEIGLVKEKNLLNILVFPKKIRLCKPNICFKVLMLIYRCRTDFADIQNKKECGGNRQWQNHYLRNWAANTKGKGII